MKFAQAIVRVILLLALPAAVFGDPAAPPPNTAAEAEGEAPAGPSVEQATPTAFARHWDLDPSSRQPLFTFHPHKPAYFLFARYSDSVNDTPFRGVLDVGPGRLDIESVEAKFQLSFKLKALKGLFSNNADLWVAYTQQSHWQMYNSELSSPFRETDYEPETFLLFRTDYDLLGLRGRFVNLGFVHQSNGRGEPLSRSWDRLYLQFGFEAGERFGLHVKPWWRLREAPEEDDNPQIEDYIGRIEVLGTYHWGRQHLSLLGRSNLDADQHRGAAQLEWNFPLYEQLRGYVQVFSGYGESLIDYDHPQTTVGIGFLVLDWM